MKKVSGGRKKILNYLDDFIESDNFQNTVYWIRKKFKIPKTGFKPPKNIFRGGFVNVPKRLIKTDFSSYIRGIAEDLPINDQRITAFLHIYILYNMKNEDMLHDDRTYAVITGGLTVGDIFKTYTKYTDGSTNKKTIDKEYLNLCIVEDLKKDIETYTPLFSSKHIIGIIEHKYKKYPVVIGLHPNISRNDLIDYIERNWKSISSRLEQHKDKKSKLGKLRTRKTSKKEKYDFIYKNRSLSKKVLADLIYDKFQVVLGHEEINKIISDERKRRR